MSVMFKWLGHSAFLFTLNGHEVLIDPFLSDNPLAAAKADDLSPEVILLSHAHGDHVGDSIDIAKRTNATVVCNFEMGNWYLAKGIEKVFQGNPGGTFENDYMTVKWTIAHHSSSFPDGTYGGQPNGFIIKAAGKTMYFAGDTSLFMDMQLIGEENLDVAFLPIGDVFTMGPEDSVKAVRYLKPRYVVPMHYNTFPPIVQDAAEWAERINRETEAQPIVLDPGNEHTLD